MPKQATVEGLLGTVKVVHNGKILDSKSRLCEHGIASNASLDILDGSELLGGSSAKKIMDGDEGL